MAPPITRQFVDALHRLEDGRNLKAVTAMFSAGAELNNPTALGEQLQPEG